MGDAKWNRANSSYRHRAVTEEQGKVRGSEDVAEQEERDAPSRLSISQELAFPELPYTIFVDKLLDARLPHARTFQWATQVDTLDEVLPYAIATGRGLQVQVALLDLEQLVGAECLVYLWLKLGTLYGHVAARELPVVAQADEWVTSSFPRAEPTHDQSVPLTFWSEASYGAHALMRTITVPPWEDISANYPSRVREELAMLCRREFHPTGGQLILWYGPPGTGKTHSLRALAWEWRTWCETHYVTDPERFFGNSAYMMEVLLQEDEHAGREDEDQPPKWRLLILEDTGELLAADAKEQAGQGLSRLLNVVDGIIGQGLRVLVLVTTNEPLTRLHPAISRPGRCAARVEFTAFPQDEAAEWLAGYGSDAAARELTLAELYALGTGAEVREKVRLGFTS
jgi:ATPase family associated with various cellular activities (AAA)